MFDSLKERVTLVHESLDVIFCPQNFIVYDFTDGGWLMTLDDMGFTYVSPRSRNSFLQIALHIAKTVVLYRR